MTGSLNIRKLFKEYGDIVDASLRRLFEKMPSHGLYGHMAYFMGLADENLKPLETYGGKRFRSSLCLMLADWLGEKEGAVPVATSIELFHNFTLIHDDIVDGDTLRRGRKTVWNVWGIPHAINSGDVQMLLAYKVLSENRDLGASRALLTQSFLTEQYIKVGEGQYLDFLLTEISLDDKRVTEEAYFEMISQKTADLIAAATKSAGLVAGVSENEVEALRLYGHNLGVAYQLCDDVVSIWGKKEQTGKREYGDVLERKKTLPILYAYAELNESEKKRLSDYYSAEGNMNTEAAEEIICLLDTAGAYEHTTKLVGEYAQKAKDEILKLSIEEEQKQTLSDIVDALLPDIKKV